MSAESGPRADLDFLNRQRPGGKVDLIEAFYHLYGVYQQEMKVADGRTGFHKFRVEEIVVGQEQSFVAAGK